MTLAIAALAAGAYVAGSRSATAPDPSFQRLTFRRGIVRSARFAPDGKGVIYSAAWDGNNPRPFLARSESPESQPLDLPDADILAVSRKGEKSI